MIDYQELLRKYIIHVECVEGGVSLFHDYLQFDRIVLKPEDLLTDEEWAELQSKSITTTPHVREVGDGS